MTTHPVLHSLQNLGLATWAGGSLMGAVGLNGAAAALDDPREQAAVATAGWRRWAPVNAAGLGAFALGGTGLLLSDRHRPRGGRAAGSTSAKRTSAKRTAPTSAVAQVVATTIGMGVAAWSARLSQNLVQAGPVPVQGSTQPGPDTPPDVARTQLQLKVVQWLNPLVAFSLVGLSSWQAEQDRLQAVTRRPLPMPSPTVAGGLAALTLLAVRRRRTAARREQDIVVFLDSRVAPDAAEGQVVDLDAPATAPTAAAGRPTREDSSR